MEKPEGRRNELNKFSRRIGKLRLNSRDNRYIGNQTMTEMIGCQTQFAVCIISELMIKLMQEQSCIGNQYSRQHPYYGATFQ